MKNKFIIGTLILIVLIGIIATKWQFSKKAILQQFSTTVSEAKNFNEKSLKNESIPLNKLLKDRTDIVVLIDKSDYQLHIYSADTLVKTYSVVFGGNPVDDKLREGDQCTPEGTFKIVSKYPHKSWSKFIWINYPTDDSWKKHNKAKADGLISKDASIGGEIGIHGVPKGIDDMIAAKTNWTLGCISLTNEAINDIYPFFDKETLITIRK